MSLKRAVKNNRKKNSPYDMAKTHRIFGTGTRPAGTLVFAFGGGEDGINSGSQAAVIIPILESGADFISSDPLAKGVGQHCFQPIADLYEHFSILNKNEQDGPVVFGGLPHPPGA